MRFRYLLLIFVVVFAATLAVIVGEQLSSESLAVMVCVVAGVGASLPTSLLVLWFAVRTAKLRAVAEAPATRHFTVFGAGGAGGASGAAAPGYQEMVWQR